MKWKTRDWYAKGSLQKLTMFHYWSLSTQRYSLLLGWLAALLLHVIPNEWFSAGSSEWPLKWRYVLTALFRMLPGWCCMKPPSSRPTFCVRHTATHQLTVSLHFNTEPMTDKYPSVFCLLAWLWTFFKEILSHFLQGNSQPLLGTYHSQG